MRLPALIVGGIAVVIALFTMLGSFYTIDQGERGVILRNGAVVGIAEPGLHFKTPFLETVVDIATTQRTTYWTCVQVKDRAGNLQRSSSCSDDERSEMLAYSRDQQPAAMRVTVSWHAPADQVETIYSDYSSLSNLEGQLIARRAPQAVKTVFGQYTATSAVDTRAKLNANVLAAVENAMKGEPVVIDGVQIENVDYSDAYETAVEERMNAEVEVQKLQQKEKQAEVAARTTVVNAQAQADSKLAVAKAAAEATKIAGEAEAAAIRAKGDALHNNPDLIDLIRAERWNGSLPTTMVPGSAVPFVNVK